jgi:hypothetical protein
MLCHNYDDNSNYWIPFAIILSRTLERLGYETHPLCSATCCSNIAFRLRPARHLRRAHPAPSQKRPGRARAGFHAAHGNNAGQGPVFRPL